MEPQFSIPVSDQNSLLRNRLQLFLVQKLKESKSSPDDLSQLIEILLSLLKKTGLNPELSDFSIESVVYEFRKYFYGKILSQIFSIIDSLKLSSSHFIAVQLNSLLCLTNFNESFGILYDFCVAKQSEIFFHLIKNFISRHSIRNLIAERIETNFSNQSLIEDTCILKICSLPDKFMAILEPKVAFKNKKIFLNFFMPNNYFQILIADLYMFIKQNCLNLNQNAIRLISTLYGKISFIGYGQLLFENLTKNLLILSYKQNEWKSISKNLFENVPYKYLESCLFSLIRKSSW